MSENHRDERPVLVTGATGYVGGRLAEALVHSGRSVRCMARRPEYARELSSAECTVVAGDVSEPASLVAALEGIGCAYYLVHSMGAPAEFEERDRVAALNFARAASVAGIERIVYLGALADEREELSPHLRSRHEVGRLLRAGDVPTLELRASIVLGAGSLSFEMVRALVERLPVMVTPKWVDVEAQPIAIDDLIEILVRAADVPLPESRAVEIGGADRVSYGGIMAAYARRRGLKRRMLRIPVLTPRLSSLWLGLVTPIYARVGTKLIESIRHPTVVLNPDAAGLFGIVPVGIDEAIARALDEEDRKLSRTRWCDALSSAGEPRSWESVRFGNRLVDSRSVHVPVPPAAAFAPVQSIGGAQGWYAWDSLWQLRGALDLLLGGVGMRRGRRHPAQLRVGDPLDFWRVEAFEPDRLLRLSAEMKLPGRAWLQFEVEPEASGSRVRQTAIFDPIGLAGLAYWYGVWPVHALVFRDMLRGIARAAVRP